MPSLQPQGDTNAPLEWADALSAADIGDDKYVVTSPNMTFIPSPHIGIVEVTMRADYRYGIPDPVQWPQVFADQCDYFCAMLRPVSVDHPYAPIWWTPKESDFVILEGSVFTCLGLLKPDAVSALSALVDDLSQAVSACPKDDERLPWLNLTMCQTRDRLKYFPCTFRDACLQVRETQRYWLMARACLDWVEKHIDHFLGSPMPANTGLMGAFSTSAGVVQNLHNAGIPVWFIRTDVSILNDTSVRAIVIPTPPDNICVDVGPEGGHVLYRGLVGAEHLVATIRSGHTYLDVSRTPLLVVDSVGGYPSACSQKDYKGILVSGSAPIRAAVASTPGVRSRDSEVRMKLKAASTHTPYPRPHASQVRGTNKFEHFDHPWMPNELPAWQHAMRTVDLSEPARPNPEIWGYWIPEPALLLRPKTTDRRDRYIMTWLRIRAAWLYLLRVPDIPVTSVPTQWWRDILYGHTGRTDLDPSTLRTKRWEAIKKVFGTIFQDTHFDSVQSGRVWWFGHRVSTVDPKLCPAIIWEMCDLGFRYELLALDRLFIPSRTILHGETGREGLLSAVFPSRHLYSAVELSLGGAGLCARVPHARVPYLEALRRVLSRWPACPASIHNGSPFATSMSTDDILSREKEIAKFYVDTFFAQSGRAPIVPHEFPVVPDPA